MNTKQIEFWKGSFGREYTDRNLRDSKEWEELHIKKWGISKLRMNDEFIGKCSRQSKILEVGCNAGMQLAGLQQMGFKNLYGIELLTYAAAQAKEFTKGLNIIVGSGFEIPFKDRSFDIVCTNLVLIHIAPSDLNGVINEIYRCTKKYIWGFEYYAEKPEEINYRGNRDVLWKADFADLFLKNFPDLRLKKKKLYPYINIEEASNVDSMYLLEKQSKE